MLNFLKKLFHLNGYVLKFVLFSELNKKRTTIMFIHGIGNSGKSWQQTAEFITGDYNLVAVDLLGFGSSPKPEDPEDYTNQFQAKCILKTLKKIGIKKDVILVGHSMGSLIAIELDKLMKNRVQDLILCSPPIYKSKNQAKAFSIDSESMLKKAYRVTADNADQNVDIYIKIGRILKSLKVTPSLVLNEFTVGPYANSLKNSILKQTAYESLQDKSISATIIFSLTDPFVLYNNLKLINKHNPKIELVPVIGSHEITKNYIKKIVATLKVHDKVV